MALTGLGWRRAAVAVVGLAAAGLAVRVLFDSSDELLTAADTLTSVRVWWVVAAVGLEVLSYAARGAANAVVLRRGGAVVGAPAGVLGHAAPELRPDVGEYPVGHAARLEIACSIARFGAPRLALLALVGAQHVRFRPAALAL